MKNYISYVVLVLVFTTSSVFFACDNDKEITTPPEDTELVTGLITLDATSYDDWVYFSFADTLILEVDDYLNSTAWDIGFHRFDIRLNCGTAGIGSGGSLNAGKVDFDAITEAPENGYSLNDSIEVIEESGNWVYQAVPGDTILSSWLTFAGPPPTYTVNDNIYIIKTADGKYVKIWLKDYYSDYSVTGHVTMKYIYQPDGTTSFESSSEN